MPRLDTDIIVHCLPTKEDGPPIKQKFRCMRPDMSKKIKAKVMKQFDAGFLVVTSYPQWCPEIPYQHCLGTSFTHFTHEQ